MTTFTEPDPEEAPIETPEQAQLSGMLGDKSHHEGVPVCRSVEESEQFVAEKRLVIYPNGNVMVWDADRAAVWNPGLPLSDQPAIHITLNMMSGTAARRKGV